MEPSNWDGPLPARSQSTIRKILEQVKSGEKNKTDAFAELRGILNSSSGKNLGTTLMGEEPEEMSERVIREEERLQTQLLTQTPSRFSQEDRRMLINKLIEKRRRSDDKIPTISPLTGANLSASELQNSDYRHDHDTYNSNESYQEGLDENKWGGDDGFSESDRIYQNGTSRQSRDSRDRGDREEKGTPPPSPPRDSSPHSSISGATRSLSHQNSRNRTPSHSQLNRNSNDYNSRSHERSYYYENNDSGERGDSYRRSRDYDRGDSRGDRGSERGRERGSGYYYDVHNSDISNGYELHSNDDNRLSRNDTFFSDARSNRMVQNEALIREEMFRECTFRPRIKELPSAYGIGKDFNGNRDGPFYDRVIRWKESKEEQALLRKQQLERTDTIDCTFHPRMNRNSERAMKEIRGDSSAHTVGERLYRNSEAVYMTRAKAIEEELRKERSVESSSCTFQPVLVDDNGKFSNVKSKFQLPVERNVRSEQEERIARDCTFTPKVKGVSSRMPSAQLYVRTDVVERLTRSTVPTPSVTPHSSDCQDLEDDASRGHLENGGSGFLTPYDKQREGQGRGRGIDMNRSKNQSTSSSAGQRRRSSSASASLNRKGGVGGFGSRDDTHQYNNQLLYNAHSQGNNTHTRRAKTDDSLSSEEAREREARFQHFLGRQQQSALRHAQHLKTLATSSTPKFQPALCVRSLEMSENHFKGDFLDRLERDVLRRNDSENRLLASSRSDNGCTFQPSILEKSERLRSRSSYEMSRGDLLKRETNHRMMKLRLDREELNELTFRPEISYLAKNTESALRLKENPSYFLEYHKSSQSRRTQMKEKEMSVREEDELKSCTFFPVTIECPSYVKRIARSMAAVKAAAAQSKAFSPNETIAEKPLWK